MPNRSKLIFNYWWNTNREFLFYIARDANGRDPQAKYPEETYLKLLWKQHTCFVRRRALPNFFSADYFRTSFQSVTIFIQMQDTCLMMCDCSFSWWDVSACGNALFLLRSLYNTCSVMRYMTNHSCVIPLLLRYRPLIWLKINFFIINRIKMSN